MLRSRSRKFSKGRIFYLRLRNPASQHAFFGKEVIMKAIHSPNPSHLCFLTSLGQIDETHPHLKRNKFNFATSSSETLTSFAVKQFCTVSKLY